MTPTELVHGIFNTRYAKANCIFFCGSAARNEMTEHSDVDVIVLFEKLPYAYRETYRVDGWLLDVQVHDPETLNYLMVSDGRLGSVIVASMVADSIRIPGATPESERIAAIASKIVSSGPPPQDFSGVRYMVANIIADLKQSKDRHETLAIGVELYKILSTFYFRSRNEWPATKKMIPRQLALLDPEINKRFYFAFYELFSKCNVDAAIRLAEGLLLVVGGPIAEGFKMNYSPQARLAISLLAEKK